MESAKGGRRLPIAILDFGSQFSHLISRRLRDANVYCEILPPDIAAAELSARQVQGIILSGGPASVYEEGAPPFNADILSLPVPILGICYGYQLLARTLGGRVVALEEKEFGQAELEIAADSRLLHQVNQRQTVWMSHGDAIIEPPPGFERVAYTASCPFAVVANNADQRYGIQFHPEVHHTPHGRQILANFAIEICGCEPNWDSAHFLASIEENIRTAVGDRNVFLLVSGGIDSTVTFVLLNQVLGADRVHGLYIDTGLLRPGDTQMVIDLFGRHGIENFTIHDASAEFLSALAGVSEPERKRHIIGELFLEVKDRQMAAMDLDPERWLLAQGTIYPDIITSGGTQHARVIKTHHNALASLRDMEVIEPLRYLYKDEVRQLAAELGMPREFIWKHPFPGPGVAVRIAGAMTVDKIALYHRLDRVVLDHLRASPWYERLWMGFPILVDMAEVAEADFAFPADRQQRMAAIVTEHLAAGGAAYETAALSVLPIRSVGVKGDYRAYEHPAALLISIGRGQVPVDHDLIAGLSTELTNQTPGINRVLLGLWRRDDPERWGKIVVLRLLESVDTMTADWAQVDHDLLAAITANIVALAAGIDAVLLDVTQKPPSTMEWE